MTMIAIVTLGDAFEMTRLRALLPLCFSDAFLILQKENRKCSTMH